MADAFRLAATAVDFSSRIQESHAIVGSPATNAITSVCAVTFSGFGNLQVADGVYLEGTVSLTVGTSGSACKVDIRQTGTSGAVIATTGALTVSAGNLVSFSIQGKDASPLAAGVWIIAVTITAGAATSTVSGTSLFATVV